MGHFHLLTASEAEKEFGNKYFYRQSIYRLAEKGYLVTLERKGQKVFMGNHVLEAFLKRLREKIEIRFPEIDIKKLQIYYDATKGQRIVIDGLFGKGISVNTAKENEDDLLKKLDGVMEWVQQEEVEFIEEESLGKELDNSESANSESSIAQVLPEEISWIKVNETEIEGIEIKSGILISIPSIAQFIGIRTDNFVGWVNKNRFNDYILSVHHKKIDGTQIQVPWKKGISTGFIPFIPFEWIPEIIVSFKHSGRSAQYPKKAELLYELAKNTLNAVGLVISGNKDKAAQELADVGKKLGLDVADQIIGIFKQYESREYQVLTNKEFASKVKAEGGDYAVVTGKLTLGITERTAASWKLFGVSRQLPSKQTASGREVMRQLSPADGVGMTFGERHYIKEPNITEAIKTGRQGKEFYKRLKNVGLLNDDTKKTNTGNLT